MDHIDLRKAWNNKKSKWKRTHTPQCKRCGYFAPWRTGNGLDIHHVQALIDGGDNSEENLVVLCHCCHDEWHRQYEGIIAFDKFMKTPPLFVWFYAYEKKIPFSVDDIKNNWGNVHDYILTHEPYKNAECTDYVKKHCSEWVDW